MFAPLACRNWILAALLIAAGCTVPRPPPQRQPVTSVPADRYAADSLLAGRGDPAGQSAPPPTGPGVTADPGRDAAGDGAAS